MIQSSSDHTTRALSGRKKIVPRLPVLIARPAARPGIDV